MNNEIGQQLFRTTDTIIFFLFLCSVGYLFIFAVFACKKQKVNFNKTKKNYRFLVLFTTNEIDENIFLSLHSFFCQNFPETHFHLAVIAQTISESSFKNMAGLPVTLIQSPKGEAIRSRKIDYALHYLEDKYDVVVIMKKGNTVDPNFLEEINKAYHSGVKALQTHYSYRNIKSSKDLLNSMSAEINNSIFRRGHVNLGFSSSLIGTGMAFEYDWLKKNITKIHQNGLTKQLETLLLKQGIFIHYTENLYTYDECVRTTGDPNERQNWYSAKSYSLKHALADLPQALLAGNFDYSDKIIQWTIPSRFTLLFAIALIAVVLIVLNWILAIKWFGLLIFMFLVLDLSVPTRFQNNRSILALFYLPVLFVSTLLSRLRIK